MIWSLYLSYLRQTPFCTQLTHSGPFKVTAYYVEICHRRIGYKFLKNKTYHRSEKIHFIMSGMLKPDGPDVRVFSTNERSTISLTRYSVKHTNLVFEDDQFEKD